MFTAHHLKEVDPDPELDLHPAPKPTLEEMVTAAALSQVQTLMKHIERRTPSGMVLVKIAYNEKVGKFDVEFGPAE